MDLLTWAKQYIVSITLIIMALNLCVFWIDGEKGEINSNIEESYDKSIHENINASIYLENVLGYSLVLVDPQSNITEKIAAKKICNDFKNRSKDSFNNSISQKNNIISLEDCEKGSLSLSNIRKLVLLLSFILLSFLFLIQKDNQKEVLENLEKIRGEIKELNDSKTKDENTEEKEELNTDSIQMYV